MIVAIERDGGPIAQARVDFRATRVTARARLATGTYCGVVEHGFRSTLGLRIDRVTPTIEGSWLLSHTQTIRPDNGKLSGLLIGNIAVISLQTDSTGTCNDAYRLHAIFDSLGTLRQATYAGVGDCYEPGTPSFQLVERADFVF